jgi:two-component system chemotaxis response regulator CheB
MRWMPGARFPAQEFEDIARDKDEAVRLLQAVKEIARKRFLMATCSSPPEPAARSPLGP